uniref:Uncharacterized protein n=1 Tax=Sipha flava TaxID=143950 RepID=A0A2S2Q9Z2_9HEMI
MGHVEFMRAFITEQKEKYDIATETEFYIYLRDNYLLMYAPLVRRRRDSRPRTERTTEAAAARPLVETGAAARWWRQRQRRYANQLASTCSDGEGRGWVTGAAYRCHCIKYRRRILGGASVASAHSDDSTRAAENIPGTRSVG